MSKFHFRFGKWWGYEIDLPILFKIWLRFLELDIRKEDNSYHWVLSIGSYNSIRFMIYLVIEFTRKSIYISVNPEINIFGFGTSFDYNIWWFGRRYG